VDALHERLGTGWAVNGIEPVLRALAHGQVRTLFVDPTVEQAGLRGARRRARCGGRGHRGGTAPG
jgi:peptide subunit release factor 1 (eRF1)